MKAAHAHESSEARTINKITAGLDAEQTTTVNNLMKQLPKLWEAYRSRQGDLGRALLTLQSIFATAGRAGRFTGVLKQLGIPKATAYEAINATKAVDGLPEVVLAAAQKNNVDLSSPKIAKRLAKQPITQDISEGDAERIIKEVSAPRKAPAQPATKRDPADVLADVMYEVLDKLNPADKADLLDVLRDAVTHVAFSLDLPSFTIKYTKGRLTKAPLLEAAA